MAHTKILLREDVDDLGARGEIVRVRAGYARNYLLPRKLAVEATANNVKQIERERSVLLKKEASERATADVQAEQMRALVLNFERKAGEQGSLYGSVTSMDIAEALKDVRLALAGPVAVQAAVRRAVHEQPSPRSRLLTASFADQACHPGARPSARVGGTRPDRSAPGADGTPRSRSCYRTRRAGTAGIPRPSATV